MSTTTLSGLQQASINQDKSASVDTGITVTIPNNISQCSAVGKRTSETNDAFLQRLKLTSSSSTINNDLPNNLLRFWQDLTDSSVDSGKSISGSNYSSINTYLTNITNSIIPYYRLVKSCLNEDKSVNLDTLASQRESTDEAKLRVEAMKHPEQHVSYYEGWFPLFRPMSETGLFAIFGTALFLLLVSVGIFLRMAGIELNISLPPSPFTQVDGTSYSKYAYIAAGIGAVVGFIGLKKGWFGSK
jgi:hypothetical protein